MRRSSKEPLTTQSVGQPAIFPGKGLALLGKDRCPAGWRRGAYGNINCSGRPFDKSRILKRTDKDFLRVIEPGIRPLVRQIIAKGYDTFSSCEGHRYPDGRRVLRNVDVIIEMSEARSWLVSIRAFNSKRKLKLRYHFMSGQVALFASTRLYQRPVRILFDIGFPDDADIVARTRLAMLFFRRMPAVKQV